MSGRGVCLQPEGEAEGEQNENPEEVLGYDRVSSYLWYSCLMYGTLGC